MITSRAFLSEEGAVEDSEFQLGELDEAWARALAEAEQRARAARRADITTYLALRTSNDLLRKTGADWLQAMFITVAGEPAYLTAGIQVSKEDGYRFKVGNATMVGSRLSLTRGLRTLFVEVGWPRAPGDSFIRGGGLACANVAHLGIKTASEQLRLVVDAGGIPHWKVQSHRAEAREIHEADIRKHIALLLDNRKTSQQPS